MSANQNYAVFGLGRYGTAVARELVSNGAEVMAVDIDEDIVNEMVYEIPVCKCADVTNAEALHQLGISNIDVVIIAMASNLEASVMAIMLCKEAGVKTVIAKCANETHRKILRMVGADQVMLPEIESGIRLARNLINPGQMDIFDISPNVSIEKMDVKPEWEGKTLQELNLRRKYSINIIAIYENSRVTTNIEPEQVLNGQMKLIAITDRAKRGRMK